MCAARAILGKAGAPGPEGNQYLHQITSEITSEYQPQIEGLIPHRKVLQNAILGSR